MFNLPRHVTASLAALRIRGALREALHKNLTKGFWTFLTASLCFGLGMSIFFFLYNLYLLDRGFNERFLGLVTSALAIGSIAGTLPSGILARRFGLRRSLLVCFILVAAVSALRALVVSEGLLLGLAFLGGAVFSMFAVSISPAVAQLTSEQNRSIGFSLVFSSGIGVGVLAGQVGGHLPGWLSHISPLAADVRAKQAALLIASGIAGLAVLPASWLTFASVPVREKKLYPRGPFMVRFLSAIAVWSLVAGSFSPFFNAYFSQYLRMPVERIGTTFSGTQLSQVLAILIAPAVFRRFGLIAGIMYTQIATAICLGWLAVGPKSSAAIGYMAYAAAQWMSEPGIYSLLMSRVTPAEQSGASALNFLVMSTATAIAGTATGTAIARFGYPAVLSVVAVVALFAAALFRLLLGIPADRAAGSSLATLEPSPIKRHTSKA